MKPLKMWMNIFLFLPKEAFATMGSRFLLPLIHDIGPILMANRAAFLPLFSKEKLVIQYWYKTTFSMDEKRNEVSFINSHCENDVSILTATVIDFCTIKLFVMIVCFGVMTSMPCHFYGFVASVSDKLTSTAVFFYCLFVIRTLHKWVLNYSYTAISFLSLEWMENKEKIFWTRITICNWN